MIFSSSWAFLCVMKASSYKLYSNKKRGNTLTACTQVFIHDRLFLMWKKSKTRPELTTNALLIGIILCVCLLFASINKLHIFSHCRMWCVEVVFFFVLLYLSILMIGLLAGAANEYLRAVCDN